MSYAKSALASGSNDVKAAYERTLARISKVREQVENAPRGGSMSGKVCIITGVGSMLGIG